MAVFGSNLLLAQQAQQAALQQQAQVPAVGTQLVAQRGNISTASQLLSLGAIQSNILAERRASGEGAKISRRTIYNAAVGNLFTVTPLAKEVKVHNLEDTNTIDYEA